MAKIKEATEETEQLETLYLTTNEGRQSLIVPSDVKETFEIGEMMQRLRLLVKGLEELKSEIRSQTSAIERLKNDLRIKYKIEIPKEYGRIDKIVEYVDDY